MNPAIDSTINRTGGPMTLREALNQILAPQWDGDGGPADELAPHIEKALDKLIIAMSDAHLCAMPEAVRVRWHEVFVAAMMEKS